MMRIWWNYYNYLGFSFSVKQEHWTRLFSYDKIVIQSSAQIFDEIPIPYLYLLFRNKELREGKFKVSIKCGNQSVRNIARFHKDYKYIKCEYLSFFSFPFLSHACTEMHININSHSEFSWTSVSLCSFLLLLPQLYLPTCKC